MASQIKSRTQRRMEKKQALIFLILVLAASLVSFALGVMVGRNGTSSPAASRPVAKAAPVRMPIAQQAKPEPSSQPPAATAKASAPAPAKEKLTFYDTLPKGKASPMGSGINLPPGAKQPEKGTTTPLQPAAASPTAAPSPKGAPAQRAVKANPAPANQAASKSSPTPNSAPAPTTKAAGTHVVQVASFRHAKDAKALRQRLVKKGYAAYIRQADLGAKGIWNRVYVGPFASTGEAERVASRLKAEEKLSVLVKRR